MKSPNRISKEDAQGGSDVKKMLQSLARDQRTAVVKVMLIGIAVLLIYGNDLYVTFSRAVSFNAGNISNYVLVIPFLILFVLYRKRRIILAVTTLPDGHKKSPSLDDVLGATLCFIAITVFFLGSSTFYSLEYHLLSLPIFIAGAVMLLFNIETTRQVLIAIILIAYLQPPPTEVVAELAADLSWASAVVVQYILSGIGLPIGLDASFGAPALVVQGTEGARIPFYVGEPSSGTFSLVGLSVFSLFVAYILRGPFWKRAIVVVAGFPLFYLLNTMRIATIISIWYTSGELAAESFHVVSGMTMSAVGTVILLIFADRVLKLRFRDNKNQKALRCSYCEKSLSIGESLCVLCGRMTKPIRSKLSAPMIGRMALLILISGLVVFGQVTAIRANESFAQSSLSTLDISTIKGPETTAYFFPELEGWDLSYAYRDTVVEKILNQDATLAYRYSRNDLNTESMNPSGLNILAGLQISRTLHTWEGSLLIYPSKFGRPTATVYALETVDIGDNKQGRLFVYQKPESELTEAVLYWTDQRELRFGSGFESRNVQIILWASVNSLVKEGAIKNLQDIEGIKELLLSLAIPISSHWDNIAMSSKGARVIDLFISERPYIPIAAIVLGASIMLIIIYSRNMSRHKLYRLMYERIKAGDEKTILDLIRNAKATERLTGRAIAERNLNLTGEGNGMAKLFKLLVQIRNVGFIKGKILSDSDEPLLVWKTNFPINKSKE